MAYEVIPGQVSAWKNQILIGVSNVFENGVVKNDDEKEKVELFKKVGQLQMQVDFLKKVLGK